MIKLVELEVRPFPTFDQLESNLKQSEMEFGAISESQ